MRICVATALAALLTVGYAFPVSADDFVVTTPKWAELSKDRQDEVIKELTRQGVLRVGKDRVIYRPFGQSPMSTNQPDVQRSEIIDALICRVCRCC
jgi:hypothetical protein